MDNENLLKNSLKEIFVKKEVDMNNPIVLASIISAASGMANASDIISPENARNELLNLYNQSENDELRNMSYLNSNYVKHNIGYSVEFEDYGKASACYMAQKDVYDKLYGQISELSKTHEQPTGKSL